MEESSFVSVFRAIASDVMGNDAIVEPKASLFYQLYLDKDLSLIVQDTRIPRRGDSAFETDICIFEMVDEIKFPRIVIEFKPKITTHDILTYSVKAGRHKKIYPCLRYGLLASDLSSIPRRFFMHNENLDFFIAAQNYSSESEVRSFASKLIRKELEISKELQRIHFSDEKVDYYRTEIVFGKFGEVQ
ncbi:MAG: hypothetical protein WBD16_15555 [Pyrinomonadaceae bacterium]